MYGSPEQERPRVVAGILMGYPLWGDDERPFLEGTPPKAAPSIVNAADLGLATGQA